MEQVDELFGVPIVLCSGSQQWEEVPRLIKPSGWRPWAAPGYGMFRTCMCLHIINISQNCLPSPMPFQKQTSLRQSCGKAIFLSPIIPLNFPSFLQASLLPSSCSHSSLPSPHPILVPVTARLLGGPIPTRTITSLHPDPHSVHVKEHFPSPSAVCHPGKDCLLLAGGHP